MSGRRAAGCIIAAMQGPRKARRTRVAGGLLMPIERLMLDPHTETLHIRLLGVPCWQRGNRAAVPLSRKDAALLALLALEGPQPKRVLWNLVWPGKLPPEASNSMRQRAIRLRKAAGQPLFEGSATVALHPRLRVDVRDLASLSDDVLLDPSGLLAGQDLGDHSELDHWLQEARRHIAQACAQMMGERADALMVDGQFDRALTLARRIVELAPLGEHGWRRLMELHHLRGDRGAAVEAYWQLNELLRKELGVLPDAATRQLLQTVEAAGRRPASSRPQIPVSLRRPPVLIGRDAPWAAMAAAWQRDQAFLLVGEAGMGKSRLLEEFCAGEKGLVVERAQPVDPDAPMALVGRLLVQVERRFTPPASPAVRSELARLRTEFGEAPMGRANKAVLRNALETWLCQAGDKGLAGLVIDDLQCADLASLETLLWLSAQSSLAWLKLGMASRPWQPDPQGQLLSAWLVESQRPLRIDLKPLARDELVQLLASLALPELVDERAADLLFRRAGGQPYLTLAALQHAIVQRVPLGQMQSLGLPESVQSLLDSRLRDLPAHCVQLLQVAAVGGMDLTVERASCLLGCAPLALSQPWAALEAADVLRGERFSHDMVWEAALRAVPQGPRQHLHREWAALLQDEAGALPASVATHWELGQAWSQAGRSWQAAALAARLAGRLAEQTTLFERAAECHSKANDPGARCDALIARLEGLHLSHGAAAVLAALPEADALADTTVRQMRSRVARAEALLDQSHASAAAEQARLVLGQADGHPILQVEARAQLAIALAQLGEAEPALASARLAVDGVHGAQPAPHRLKALNALMFVLWSDGRPDEALAVQREELACAEALGDRATAAASTGSRAALLAVVGDIRETHAHAQVAQRLQRDVGLAGNSTQAILNGAVLGAAAAALGRFDEALACLQQAVDLASDDAATPVRAKALLALGGLWLTLGQADRTQRLLGELPAGMPPSMQMQAAWLNARAVEAQGRAGRDAWNQLIALAAAHPPLPLMLSVAFELSYAVPAPQAIEDLSRLRAQWVARKMHGQANALAWRELVRRLEASEECPAPETVALADALLGHCAHGLSARGYPPEAWFTLAQTFDRAGRHDLRDDALRQARQWLKRATARLPPEHRAAFSERNPVNRALLAG